MEDAKVLGPFSFDASSVGYRLRVVCPPENRYAVRLFANRTIKEALDKAGMEIPFQQIDIHQK